MTALTAPLRSSTLRLVVALALLTVGLVVTGPAPANASSSASAAALPAAAANPFGPNVYVFDPSMTREEIQATVDAVAAQQVPNQFGAERYALLFQPGTYGTPNESAELPGGVLHRCRRSRGITERRRHQWIDLRSQPVQTAALALP